MTLLLELMLSQQELKSLTEAGFKLEESIETQVNSAGENLQQYALRTQNLSVQKAIDFLQLKIKLQNSVSQLELEHKKLKSFEDYKNNIKVLQEIFANLLQDFSKLLDARPGFDSSNFFKDFIPQTYQSVRTAPSLIENLDLIPISQFILRSYTETQHRDQQCVNTVLKFIKTAGQLENHKFAKTNMTTTTSTTTTFATTTSATTPLSNYDEPNQILEVALAANIISSTTLLLEKYFQKFTTNHQKAVDALNESDVRDWLQNEYSCVLKMINELLIDLKNYEKYFLYTLAQDTVVISKENIRDSTISTVPLDELPLDQLSSKHPHSLSLASTTSLISTNETGYLSTVSGFFPFFQGLLAKLSSLTPFHSITNDAANEVVCLKITDLDTEKTATHYLNDAS